MNMCIMLIKFWLSSRLETIKRFLKRYVATNKLIGNSSDEYALVLLTDVAVWVFCDFFILQRSNYLT